MIENIAPKYPLSSDNNKNINTIGYIENMAWVQWVRFELIRLDRRMIFIENRLWPAVDSHVFVKAMFFICRYLCYIKALRNRQLD